MGNYEKYAKSEPDTNTATDAEATDVKAEADEVGEPASAGEAVEA
jgi:hypothetical protein